MDKIKDQITNNIEQAKSLGDKFPAPVIDRKDVHIVETKLRACGLTRYKRSYKIDFDNGGWILVEYTSKAPSRTSATTANRSEVKVTSSDPSFNFSDSWEEKQV